MCQGYYRHSEGYTPEWPGMASTGQIIHPQTWPEDLDYKNKNVLVIGSGATAATLMPEIADECAHVTMLQRSPTYFRAGRNAIEIAETLRQLQVDEHWIHEIVRRKILLDQAKFTRRSFDEPEGQAGAARARARASRARLRRRHALHAELPAVAAAHRFRPRRDLFKTIDRARPRSSPTRSSVHRNGHPAEVRQELEADIIVTATGFDPDVLGDIEFTIDNEPLDFSDTVTYRGMMFTGVPNMVWVFGYFRASWTLRVDLVADFVCRLLGHMETTGRKKVAVALRPEDADMPLGRGSIEENFNPGYMMRGMHLLPKARQQARVAAHPGLLDREGRVSGHQPRRPGVRLRVRRAKQPHTDVVPANAGTHTFRVSKDNKRLPTY